MEEIGTLGCFSSLNLYGKSLNSPFRYGAVWLALNLPITLARRPSGDMVKAVVTKGKKQGIYIGRVAVRNSGSFNIKTKEQPIQGISHKYCTIIQRMDGYAY